MKRRKFAYSVVYPSYSVNKQEEKSLLHVHLERLSKKERENRGFKERLYYVTSSYILVS